MGAQRAHEWFGRINRQSGHGDQSACAALAARQRYPDQQYRTLTDCITMDAFLRDFGVGRRRYRGIYATTTQETCRMGRKAIAGMKAGVDR